MSDDRWPATENSTDPMDDGYGHGDVIVVGGGPVGVTTALLLARRGLSVRLFERLEPIYDLPRAVGMDAEIQRVFQNAGLEAELTELTTPLAGAEFVDTDGRRIIGHEIPADASHPLGHHPSVMYHQPWLEKMLRTAAAAAGAELNLGVEVTSVEQDDDGVSVETEADGRTRSASARWLIAADGAASPIRRSLGLAFVDQGFDQDWLVFDVELHEPVEGLGRLAQQICDPARPTTFVPGHQNFRRWEFQLQPGESAEELSKPATAWQLVAPWLSPDQGTMSRAVVYRFHATAAERFSVGRVFLAGDAAHQMPPFLGQGLCSGIRDAANLAWKLDLVARGIAGVGLLDSYDAERRPHAIDLVGHAVETGKLIDRLAGRLEEDDVDLGAGYGGGREFPHLRHGLLAGAHPRVGKPLLQPTVDGVRFDEQLGSGFALLVRDRSAVPAEVVDRWQAVEAVVVEVPAGVLEREVPIEGGVVVRPDRYIAAVADGWDGLAAATDELLAKLGR